MIIVITKNEDNYKSKIFNRFLEKIPCPFRIVFANEDLETTYHKVLGAVCVDEDSYNGGSHPDDYDMGTTD